MWFSASLVVRLVSSINLSLNRMIANLDESRVRRRGGTTITPRRSIGPAFPDLRGGRVSHWIGTKIRVAAHTLRLDRMMAASATPKSIKGINRFHSAVCRSAADSIRISQNMIRHEYEEAERFAT